MGDGANDIPMLHAAGLGIAFCAKPKVGMIKGHEGVGRYPQVVDLVIWDDFVGHLGFHVQS